MIYDIKLNHWCNLCTICKYNWTKLCVFHICGGHFEYFKLLKGGNVPPTWNCSLRPYKWIIKRKKKWPKWPPSAKSAKLDLSDFEKSPLERFKQIYLSICDLCHLKEKWHHKTFSILMGWMLPSTGMWLVFAIDLWLPCLKMFCPCMNNF